MRKVLGSIYGSKECGRTRKKRSKKDNSDPRSDNEQFAYAEIEISGITDDFLTNHLAIVSDIF